MSGLKSHTSSPRPWLLRPNNFTSASRTPWGGTRIASHYKPKLNVPPTTIIGESWELSVEPDFPSLDEHGRPLTELIAEDPVAALGARAAKRAPSTTLLVKLLDAKEALSVQIHPADDYDGLDPGESGKPECWYVLDRSPGAGLYVGLAPNVDRPTMRRAIERGDDVSALLNFVPVEPGDAFRIDPGTPHAIGGGITLLEPQRVLPGMRGVTYRYWDWNRLYDERGRQSPNGKARALHVEHALAVTDFSSPTGSALLAQIRTRAGRTNPEAPATLQTLTFGSPSPGPDEIRMTRLSGSGELNLPPASYLRGLTILAGSLRLRGHDFDLVARTGRSLVLPAALPEIAAYAERVLALITAVAHTDSDTSSSRGAT